MKSKLDQKGEESPESSAKSQIMVNAMDGAGTDGKGKDHLNSTFVWHSLQTWQYLTNRFHFAVRLYSDNAQMTSKRGENKEVRYEPQASSVTDVLTTFWRPLCVIRVQTHGKMKSICFIQ